MLVETLGNVATIYFYGESHCLGFDGALFEVEKGQRFLCRSIYIPHRIEEVYASPSAANSIILRMKMEGLIDANGNSSHFNANPHVSLISSTPTIAPAVILFVGEIDTHHRLLPYLNEMDFVLPDDPGYGFDENLVPIPFGTIYDAALEILRPFFDTVTKLIDDGFVRTMIHCLPPRCISDTVAAPWIGGGKSVTAAVRSKLTVLINRLMNSFCKENNIGFIDNWPIVSDGLYLREEFDLDGVHLNARSRSATLAIVAENLIDRTARIANCARYRDASAQSRRADVRISCIDWDNEGLFADQTEFPAIDVLTEEAKLPFEEPNRLARFDWVGWPSEGRPRTSIRQPDEAVATLIHQFLATGHAYEVLHAGAEHDLTVTSCKLVKISAEGCGRLAIAEGWDGTRRALFSPMPTERLTFFRKDLQPLAQPQIPGSTLIVYDPQRIGSSVSAGVEELVLLELALAPRHPAHQFRTIWSGLCEFPADPFHYSVEGMAVFPPMESQLFKERAPG